LFIAKHKYAKRIANPPYFHRMGVIKRQHFFRNREYVSINCYQVLIKHHYVLVERDQVLIRHHYVLKTLSRFGNTSPGFDKTSPRFDKMSTRFRKT